MSEYGSYDSDCGSGFWKPPEKSDEVLKSKQTHESEYSDSYQDSFSDNEDVESEKEFEIIKENVLKDPHKNKNGRCKSGKGDEGKPFYVPRKPHFFEHDIRILDDEEEIKEKTEKCNKKNVDSQFWKHDLFIEDEQLPKSEIELINTYGYDIRSDSPTSIGHGTFKNRRPRRQKDGNCPDSQIRSPKTLIVKEANKQQSSFSPQLTKKEGRAYKERSAYKKASCKRNPANASCDVDIHQFEKLSISHSDFADKNYSANFQDSPPRAIPTTFARNIRRDPSPPKVVILNKESSSLKYVVNPKDTNYNYHPASFQNHREASLPLSAPKGTYVFSIEPHIEIKNTMSPPLYENSIRNMRSKGEGSRQTQSPVPVLEKSYDIVDNLTSINNVLPAYVNEIYNMESRDNFEFPDPPDLSATHLMPCAPYPQYFFHPFYQQGVGSLMKWEFFGQPYYPSGSIGGVAYIKQQQLGAWANPHHQCQSLPHQSNGIPSPRHVDTSPYYALQDNANIVGDDSSVKCVSSVDATDEITAMSNVNTSHRYSYLRAMWRQRHSAKISSVNHGNTN